MKSSILVLCSVLFAGFSIPVFGAAIKDAESASHDDTASRQEITATYQFEDCRLVQFKLAVLSTYSYLLVSGSDALLVDPARDIEEYRDYIEEHKLKLTGIFLTHSHADFVAGHIEAAQKFGVPVYISEAAHAGYPHKALKDGASMTLGSVTIRFIETPGHTLDGMCALVYAGAKPQLMFSGDTLFVGSIGRPDLMGGTISAAELAGKSFATWHDKLSRLPDDLKFFPAHGAGSLCGVHLRDEPFSTIGQERRDNPYLQAKTRSAFIAKVLDGLVAAPQYFSHNAALNRQGPQLVDWTRPVTMAAPSADLIDFNRYSVVDLRSARRYAEGHLPNSLNIGVRGRLETWLGTLVAWDSALVMVADNAEELAEAARRLHSIGYSGSGILYEDWVKAKLPVLKTVLLTPQELNEAIKSAEAPVIVDVRLPSEWAGVRIENVVNLPLTKLPELAHKLKKDDPAVAVCNSAYRSSMAVGLLEREGFKRLASLDGGVESWLNAGYPVLRAESPHGSSSATASTRILPLPDRLGVPELLALIKDLPGTFELVDIRPPVDFAEFSIQGSTNVDPGELIFDARWRSGKAPLIIIDRDGTVAMAIGGILAKESPRPVKVLRGGIEAYWNFTVKGLPAEQKTLPNPVIEPEKPVKKAAPVRSAGC
ncbi:MAG: rhodanese-like domain-containing protein [Victivallaceae bacterium]